MTKRTRTAKARTPATSARNRVGSPASAPTNPNQFRTAIDKMLTFEDVLTGMLRTCDDAIDKMLTFEDVLTGMLRTCDDAIRTGISDRSRLALMASCDDVRAALGYSHRYLTPRQRRRL